MAAHRRHPEETVRTILKWTAIPALALAVACGGDDVDSDLASDLALVSGSDLELASTPGPEALIVSPLENIPAPSPRTTPSPSKKRGTKAPPPEQVMVDVAGSAPEATISEMVTVSPSDNPVAAELPAPDAPPVVRPQPIEPRYPIGIGGPDGNGSDEGRGNGRHEGERGGRPSGTTIGGVTVVIRGGRTSRDPCAIHDRDARAGASIMINNRIPTQGTFPRY
jgi:hypothetical protein